MELGIFKKEVGVWSYSKYYNCKKFYYQEMLRTTKKGEYSLMVKRLFVVQLIFVQFKVYTE